MPNVKFSTILLLAALTVSLNAQQQPATAAGKAPDKPPAPAVNAPDKTGTPAAKIPDKAAAPAAKAVEESSMSLQRRSIAQMEASIETQRQTVLKQAPPRAAGESFFISSPPKPGYPPLVMGGVTAACDPLPPMEVDSLVAEAATREQLDPALLRGVMEQESAFRPCALSPKGAMGLMQLMPGTASDLGVHDPFDPSQSVGGGAHFLKQLLQQFGGDTALALGAYNAGPGKVNEANGIPPIPETMDYVRRIMMLLPSLDFQGK